MATLNKNNSGKIYIEFDAKDLVFSNVKNTKEILTEAIGPYAFELKTKNIQEFDSSGLQLLIYFIQKIQEMGGTVAFDQLQPDISVLSSLYGIKNLGQVEKIKTSSSAIGDKNV